MKVRRLNLLVLRCREIERCRTFYESLGLCFERHRHGNGPEHYAHEDERGVFELYPASAGQPADSTGLGFAFSDLNALRQELERLGHSPSAISTNPWGTSFIVRDPDGRRVELKAAD